MKKATLLLIVFSFTFFIAQAQNSFLFSKDQILDIAKCNTSSCITAIAKTQGYEFISKAPSTKHKGCTDYTYYSTDAVKASYTDDSLMLKNRLVISLNTTTLKVQAIDYNTANKALYESQYDEFKDSYIVEDLSDNEDPDCMEFYSFVYSKMNIWLCIKGYKKGDTIYSNHSIRFEMK
jgi:hypothetical protein